MTAFLVAFQSIAPLFLVIFAGMVVSRHKAVTIQWLEVLNNYALWIGFPALILVALMKIEWDFGLYSNLIFWNSARLIFSILMVLPLSFFFKFGNQTRRTLFLAVSFGNVAYLGIPVLRNAFGDQILPEATMISSVYLFWLFTLGIFMVEYLGDEKISFKKLAFRLFTNPLLIAVFLGITVAVNQIQMPKIIMSGLNIASDSVTGIVLFSLGIFVGKQPLGTLKEWFPVLGFSLIILFVLPLAFRFVTGIFVPLSESRSWILESAMPLGLTPYALCLKYNLNTEFASRVVVASTILSLISLPIWLVFL